MTSLTLLSHYFNLESWRFPIIPNLKEQPPCLDAGVWSSFGVSFFTPHLFSLFQHLSGSWKLTSEVSWLKQVRGSALILSKNLLMVCFVLFLKLRDISPPCFHSISLFRLHHSYVKTIVWSCCRIILANLERKALIPCINIYEIIKYPWMCLLHVLYLKYSTSSCSFLTCNPLQMHLKIFFPLSTFLGYFSPSFSLQHVFPVALLQPCLGFCTYLFCLNWSLSLPLSHTHKAKASWIMWRM